MAGEFASGCDEMLFVGTPTGAESRLVAAAGIRFRELAARGFDRARPWTLITSSLRIAASTVVAWAWMGANRPDVVVGFGGYVSIPVGMAAAVRGIPLVLHEQNSVPGLANRTLSRWADRVAVTYEESRCYFRHPERVVLTGNPVRSAVLGADRIAGRAVLGIEPDACVLLAFGGSRGARHINSALIGLRDRLLAIPNLVVLHVAGPSEVSTVADALAAAGGDPDDRWRVVGYLDDMGSALAAADLIVSRAGATSIAEITALGLPAVLVPFPYATDDHQTKNAAALVACGAAALVPDSELDEERFGDVLVGLLSSAERRATMSAASRTLGRPNAAEHVAQVVRSAAQRSGGVSHIDSTEELGV